MDKGKYLDSWKEISAYLGRNIRTCQIWERELGLPVHRLDVSPKARVFAYTGELDAWRDKKGRLPDTVEPLKGKGNATVSRGKFFSIRKVFAGLGVLALAAALFSAFNVGGSRDRLFGRILGGPITSVAVLPVENYSGDPDQELLAEGMTDALISGLGQISALENVISRTSVMQYKGTKKPLPQIAKELGVRGIIEASVLRSGGRVSITARLFDARRNRQIGPPLNYEREMVDILALYSEMVQAIAFEVRARITPQEGGRLKAVRPVAPDAYEAFLRGKFFLRKWTEDGVQKALIYFQKSADLEPDFAQAYAGLADAFLWSHLMNLLPWNEASQKAIAAARRALDLDEGLSEAHAVMSTAALWSWKWAEAELESRRAIALNPNSFDGHFTYGAFLTLMLHHEEAVREARRALALDPMTPTSSLNVGWTLYYAGRYDESIAQLRRTLEMAPENWGAHMELSWNYARKKMYPEAVAECRRALSLEQENPDLLGSCGRIFGLAGERVEAQECLERMQKWADQHHRDNPISKAWLYDGLGETDRSIECLERAYRDRSPGLAFLKMETYSDKLRSDPRFQDLMLRMNFPR
jgi:adenylate cyclase